MDNVVRRFLATSEYVGGAFISEMVVAVAELVSARWVMVCALPAPGANTVRTSAVYDNGKFQPNFEYALAGTPCANIVSDQICFYPCDIQHLFPDDALLAEMGAESYSGVPLRAGDGNVMGLLAVLHDGPLDDESRVRSVLQMFAGRTAAELERSATSSANERLGRIVEEAASEAYVFDTAKFQFQLVNRGARQNLGYTMAELRSMTPWDLKPEMSRERFLELVQPLFDGQKSRLEFDAVHQRKDGTRYDVAVRLQLFRQGDEPVFYAAIEDVTERRAAEAALLETTRRLDAILNNTRMAVFLMDDRQQCLFMNMAAEMLTGYRFEEVTGRPLHDVIHHTYPDGRPFPLHECAIDRALPEDNQVSGEETFVHKDGSFYPVGFTASPLRDGAGKAIGTVIEARHIGEELQARDAMLRFNEALQQRVSEEVAARRKTEEQLFQAQKMEAIGKLTGGVAHDFNNLLQVVKGNLDLLLPEVIGNERSERRVRNALVGVDRGGKLASQLLAFGRRQPLEPQSLNLGRLVRGLDDMLRRTLGEAIEIETVVGGGLWNCLADPVQVENAILNLAINARDAMGGTGKLTIEAGNASLDENYARLHPEVRAGQYVMLAVSDTGSGIPPELLEQVFEPFFTTKPEGQGTGLGLSMVYGFAKQSGGHARIYSELGQGTTVRLYLPRTRAAEAVWQNQESEAVVGGSETVLVVEDDDAVRDVVVEMLAALGYKVLKAKDGASALGVIESGLSIDLLFTDVVMPGPVRSPDLARVAQARLPNLKVLFTSGYTQNAIVHGGRLDEGVELLSKPYSREELARRIRNVLSSPGTDGANSADTTGASRLKNDQPLRVLLVEDEILIRMNTAEMLSELGCEVVEAGQVAEALQHLNAGAFDIVMCDVELPDGSGLDFAHRAAKEQEIGVVIASGRTLDPGHRVESFVVLQKPYDLEGLSRALSKARVR